MILMRKIFCEEENRSGRGKATGPTVEKGSERDSGLNRASANRSGRWKASVPTVEETKSVRPGKATGPPVGKGSERDSGLNRASASHPGRGRKRPDRGYPLS